MLVHLVRMMMRPMMTMRRRMHHLIALVDHRRTGTLAVMQMNAVMRDMGAMHLTTGQVGAMKRLNAKVAAHRRTALPHMVPLPGGAALPTNLVAGRVAG
jgi:hypothetical protein